MKKQKEFDKSLKLIAKSSFVLFLGLLLSKFFTYFYRIIIAREFGPEQYGLFSLAIMIASWFFLFSNLGLGEGIVRFFSRSLGKKDHSGIKSIFRSTFMTFTITGWGSTIILIILAPFLANNVFHEPELLNFLIIFSFSIPLTLYLSLFSGLLLSNQKINSYSFINNIFISFIKIFFIGVFIFFGLKSFSIPFSHVLGIFLTAVIAFFICAKSLKNQISFNFFKGKKEDLTLFKGILFFSIPLLFANFIGNTMGWMDSFLIGYYYGAKEVGFYNAAITISLLFTLTSQLFTQLFFPFATKEFSKGNKENVKQISQQLGKWILAFNLPLLILIVLFPGSFLNILFGPEFLAAKNSLRFLTIGFFVFFISQISQQLILMKGKSKILLIDSIIISIFNLSLNIILVPKYGIDGAAIATMLSVILLSLIFTFQSYHYLSILPVRRKSINILFSGFIAAAILASIKSFFSNNLFSLFLLTLFFLLVYSFLLLLTHSLDKNDLLIIQSFSKKLKSYF